MLRYPAPIKSECVGGRPRHNCFFSVYECLASMYIYLSTCMPGAHGAQSAAEALELDISF